VERCLEFHAKETYQSSVGVQSGRVSNRRIHGYYRAERAVRGVRSGYRGPDKTQSRGEHMQEEPECLPTQAVTESPPFRQAGPLLESKRTTIRQAAGDRLTNQKAILSK
jgi:hypothetical protein